MTSCEVFSLSEMLEQQMPKALPGGGRSLSGKCCWGRWVGFLSLLFFFFESAELFQQHIRLHSHTPPPPSCTATTGNEPPMARFTLSTRPAGCTPRRGTGTVRTGFATLTGKRKRTTSVSETPRVNEKSAAWSQALLTSFSSTERSVK